MLGSAPRRLRTVLTGKEAMASGASRGTRHVWHLVDAKDQVVGRLAAGLARVLMGKHKPTYSPHLDHGDNVVLINAGKVRFTGRKYEKKLYRWHTGWPGGLREITPRQLVQVKQQPEQIIQRAVAGMLPKNKLRNQRMKRLHVYVGEQHSFDPKMFAGKDMISHAIKLTEKPPEPPRIRFL